MHSELTTDLSILYANLHRSTANSENVVLIKTGAMNPVHRSHISNMMKTKQYLENVHHFNVIGGYISPTHDEYVQGKLRNEFINGEHRIAMCQKAIEEEGQQHWLSVDKAECMALRFNDLGMVTYSLCTFINKKLNLPKPVRVIYVAGLDLFNRCGGMRPLRVSPLGGVAVVYRPDQDKHLIISTTIQNDPNVFYVSANEENITTSPNELNDISSTSIRKKLKNNESCEHLTYPSVLNYLKMIPLKNK